MQSYSSPIREQAFITALTTAISPYPSLTAQGYSGHRTIILLPCCDLQAVELGSGQRQQQIGKDISLPLTHQNCVSSVGFTRSSVH